MGVTAFATTIGHNPVAGEIVNEDGSVNVGIQPTLRLGFAFGKDKKTTVDLTTAEVQGEYIVVSDIEFLSTTEDDSMASASITIGLPWLSPRTTKKDLMLPYDICNQKAKSPDTSPSPGIFLQK